MKSINRVILGLAFLLAVSTASAGVISYAGYSHYDTTDIVVGGGLEWLQWDVTLGTSLNDAVAQYSVDGWRVASNGDIAALFNAFAFDAVTDFNVDYSTDPVTIFSFSPGLAWSRFLEMFGVVPGGSSLVISSVWFDIGAGGDDLYGHASVSTRRITQTFQVATLTVLTEPVSYGFSSPGIGIAMVRGGESSIPEPAIFLLFASGLLGFSIRPRRRTIKNPAASNRVSK